MYFVCFLICIYGRGQGRPVKSTGPPKPASASKRLIMTAIAASSFPSVVAAWLGDSGTVEFVINPMTSGLGAGKFFNTNFNFTDAMYDIFL